jgi:iron complex transport system substrate-binding protein
MEIKKPDIEFFPERIVCLTEEPTEILYLLGEQHRIVGISGFTVRPGQARKEKPKVSAFIEADVGKIIALQPDLVIGFSDIQATIAKELISKGITVWINNYRSVEGIFKMIAQTGSLVGKTELAHHLIEGYKNDIARIAKTNQNHASKPKVYFEEWFNPLISGICWVSELIGLAGGVDIYRRKQAASLARDRIIENANEVVQLNPDIIIASWCGKKFKKEQLTGRENWNNINAVRNDFVFEIKSSDILQPGPAAATDGFRQIAQIIHSWHVFQNATA